MILDVYGKIENVVGYNNQGNEERCRYRSQNMSKIVEM